MSAGGYSGLASARELAAKTSPALHGLTSAGGAGAGGSPDRFTLHAQSPGGRDGGHDESAGRSEAGSEYGDDSFAGSSVDGSGVEEGAMGRGSSSADPSSSGVEAGAASLRGGETAALAGETAALSGSIGRQPSRVLGGTEAAGSSNRLPPPDGDGFDEEEDAFGDEGDDDDDDDEGADGKYDIRGGRADDDHDDDFEGDDEDEEEDDNRAAGEARRASSDHREPWDREGSEFDEDEDEDWQDAHTAADVAEWEVDDVVAFLADDLSMGEQMMTHAQAAQLTGQQLITMGEEELRALLGAEEQSADWQTLKAALQMIKEAKPADGE